MDFLIEIFLELYMELMLLVIPKNRRGRKRRIIAAVLAITSLCGIIALAAWGIVWIVDENNPWGYLPLLLAILLSVLQIALGIRLYTQRNKKK